MENELSVKETMTVKEVADVLGMSYDTIMQKARELGYTQNGITTHLDEKQVSEIKKLLVPRTFELKSKVDSTLTAQEENETILQAITILKQRSEEYKQRAEIAEQKCIEQKPKVEVYDSICDSSTLQDLQTVAQTIGLKNVFKILLADGIIKKDWTHDGTMYYRPYAEFNNYLVTKDGKPYDINGVSHIRPRVFVTGKGITWLTKKYSKEQEEN